MPLDIASNNLDEAREMLADANADCYMIVGTDSTLAWDIAMALEIDLPPLKVVRIQSRIAAAGWLQGHADAVGITFGYGTTPVAHLSRAESENKETVMDKVEAAQE